MNKAVFILGFMVLGFGLASAPVFAQQGGADYAGSAPLEDLPRAFDTLPAGNVAPPNIDNLTPAQQEQLKQLLDQMENGNPAQGAQNSTPSTGAVETQVTDDPCAAYDVQSSWYILCKDRQAKIDRMRQASERRKTNFKENRNKLLNKPADETKPDKSGVPYGQKPDTSVETGAETGQVENAESVGNAENAIPDQVAQ